MSLPPPQVGQARVSWTQRRERAYTATRKIDEAFCWLAVCTYVFGCENAFLPFRHDGATPLVDSNRLFGVYSISFSDYRLYLRSFLDFLTIGYYRLLSFIIVYYRLLSLIIAYYRLHLQSFLA